MVEVEKSFAENPQRKGRPAAEGESGERTPTRQAEGCCARAASGHGAAAPPNML